VRINRGGRIAQMQETSDLICEGLTRKVTGAGAKRPRNHLENSAPDTLPDNDMAPPAKAKRQRVNKVTLQKIVYFL